MADFRNDINEQANMKEPRVQRGKDEVESQPMGPNDGTPVDPPVDPPAPQGYDGGSPYQPSTGLVDITFDASFNPEFVANYEIVKKAFNQKGAEQRAIGLMRTFHNKYFKGKKKFRSDDVNPTTMMDAFNGIVKEENAKFPRKTDEQASDPGILSRMSSAAMEAGAQVSDALGISAASKMVGDAMDAITPSLVKDVAAAMQQKSASNIPIPHDPLTVTEAAGILVRGTASAIAENVAGVAEIPVKIAQMAVAGMMGGGGGQQADLGGVSQQAELLAQAHLLNPRGDFQFDILPPRMGSDPALAKSNGLKNVMTFQDAPLTSRISPLVERILSPPNTRPIPASQPEGGRLAMQAFLNYQQDIEAPYAVRR